MKTRCPGCETTFRVTPEQIKARAGKVRCGQCLTVFNALDSLLDETTPSDRSNSPVALPAREEEPAVVEIKVDSPAETSMAPEAETWEAVEPQIAQAAEPLSEPLSESAAEELAKYSGLIVPRETSEIPGYSKWAEGAVSSASLSSTGKSSSGPFTLVSLLLMLALSGQLIFYFRSEIALAAPSLRPALEALGADIPLPHHADLMSIETSDLQADPARSNLLVLQATLRNRAPYAQAYPLLELSLTDTQDNAIARRVFQPGEYLPPATTDQAFPANADLAIRLWVEVKDISAAGYRLYVFYP